MFIGKHCIFHIMVGTEGRSEWIEGRLGCEKIESWQPFQEIGLWKDELEQGLKRIMKVENLFCVLKKGFTLAYLNEDGKEPVERGKCRGQGA